MNTSRTTLLITLTGRDRPGVTSRLFAGLARYQLSVVDIEQVVIRGKLVLGVLLECDGPPDLTGIHAAVTALAADLDLEAEITTGSGSGSAGDPPARGGRLHVTLLGSPLTPAAITAIAGRIAASGANIDRIGRLARRPVTCIELEISHQRECSGAVGSQRAIVSSTSRLRKPQATTRMAIALPLGIFASHCSPHTAPAAYSME